VRNGDNLLSKIDIYLDRDSKVTRIVADGYELKAKIRFKLVFNYWIRDIVTIYKWDDGWKETVSFRCLFVVVYTIEKLLNS